MANYTAYQSAFNGLNVVNTHSVYGNINRYDIGISPSNKINPNDTVPATLIVDSRKRDVSKYPDAGQYVFELNKPYNDVVSLELVSASLPNSGYAVTEHNNKIYLAIGDTAQAHNVILTIPIGNYTYDDIDDQPTTLLTALNAAVDDAGLDFAFGFSARTQRFTVITGVGVVVRFFTGQSNSADNIIGLSGSTNFGNTTSPIWGNEFPAAATNSMPRNFMLQPNRYVTIKIRGFERCDGNTNALDGAFAVIPLDTSKGSYTLIKEGDTVDSDTYVQYFSEPLKSLRKLEITFYDPEGNVYDFNGHEHYMIFQVQSLTRPKKYTGCSL